MLSSSVCGRACSSQASFSHPSFKIALPEENSVVGPSRLCTGLTILLHAIAGGVVKIRVPSPELPRPHSLAWDGDTIDASHRC